MLAVVKVVGAIAGAGRYRRRRLPLRPAAGGAALGRQARRPYNENMTQAAFLILATLLSAATASAAQQTMRVDYYHTGNAKEEHFSLDRS